MTSIRFTDEQRRAIETVDRSVIVSAAAGSGKTAVLAERCVYLVCDAPEPFRCDVDQLLVLTFTDAAAAEMRERIVERLRDRLERRPEEVRLRDQVARAGSARISTIHSFCLWLIRRRFADANVDPLSSVLDDREATLLRREVLDELFERRYARVIRDARPLDSATIARLVDEAVRDESASNQAGDTEPPAEEEDALAFQRLVNVYGLGDDKSIARFVLRLHDFLSSLPDAEAWLADAIRAVDEQPERFLFAFIERLAAELRRQRSHCDRLAAAWSQVSDSDPYLRGVHDYATALDDWISALPADVPSMAEALDRGDPVDPSAMESACRAFDDVREQIANFRFARIPPKFPGKGEDPAGEERRQAAHKELREALYAERLKKEFAARTAQSLLDDTRKTAPYVRTLVGLVREFMAAYAARKQRLAVLDFADFERLAFGLLHDAAHPDQPSPIAREMQEMFAHVLVDEFQDINPLQLAILRLVSRECDPGRAGNLFVVGDVKQSIYRFRQAEPALFLQRWREFREHSDTREALRSHGAALSLPRNFRSRREILDTVNAVFRRLMIAGASDITYDEEAELRLARSDVADAGLPVEVHVFERGTAVEEEDDSPDDEAATDAEDAFAEVHWDQPARWSAIEREAFVIGRLLRQWIDRPGLLPAGRKLAWTDAAVLVRSGKVNAERIASVLTRLGIPAVSDDSGSLLEAREIRDIRAALEVLDNVQQDIPLASVLRSGVFGERLDEDELVEIRCLDRSVAFHEAVRRYPAQGGEAAVRDKVSRILRTINRFREDARRRPLPDVLWSLYEQGGYIGYVGGLPHGDLRLAHLNALHDLARKFATFRNQGLHRFLRLLTAMEEGDIESPAASADDPGGGAVRILTIHKSKGLQFPVVFVAGLGTKFNLRDRQGQLIFERHARIGLKVVDDVRCVEFPSPAHRQAAAEIERATREEEMRLLYVAMTRAKEKLVLLGSDRNVAATIAEDGRSDIPAEIDIVTARSHLDWVVSILRAHEPRHKECDSGRLDSPFRIEIHDAAAINGWRAPQAGEDRERPVLAAAARGAALPAGEPTAPEDPRVVRVRERLDFVYPHLAMTTQRSAMGAGEFKGRFDFTKNAEERREPRPTLVHTRRERAGAVSADEAARRGVATHRLLQHLDFEATRNSADVAREVDRILQGKWMSADDASRADCAAIEWFLTTPLAEQIRRAGRSYRREFAYITKERPHDLDRTMPENDDTVLVRGIVDGVLPTDAGLEIVDFKTDAVDRTGATTRAQDYLPQMQMYARAMSRLWKRSVTACHLVFLTAREIVTLHELEP